MTFQNPAIEPSLVDRVTGQFFPQIESIHGPDHWMRVERNGLYLAQSSGADALVVSFFALLHDSRRFDDGGDVEHGPRASVYARELHGEGKLPLTAAQLESLCVACHGHTNIIHSDDPTVGTCWDADRLDLTRLGMTPKARFLNTLLAKTLAGQGDFEAMKRFTFPVE